MKVTLWGTRGSLATPDRDTVHYGGNTSCVGVRGDDGTALVLDAGTGIRRLGASLAGQVRRVDVLLTHLHMDHIQGLGFFAPLYVEGMQVHVWGPASSTLGLRERLMRYLSPPLFPVHLRDLPCSLHLHEVPAVEDIGEFRVTSMPVVHPGPTVGYRIESRGSVMAYMPDHEPALGAMNFPLDGPWTSGFELARDADLLVHDAQYTAEEYATRAGWGHSTTHHAITFAKLARAKHLVPFHHDPAHDDATIERLFVDVVNELKPDFKVTPGAEGDSFEV